MPLDPRTITIESVNVTSGPRSADDGTIEAFVEVNGSLPDGRGISANGRLTLGTVFVGGAE